VGHRGSRGGQTDSQGRGCEGKSMKLEHEAVLSRMWNQVSDVDRVEVRHRRS
jgi:hypothetical protein